MSEKGGFDHLKMETKKVPSSGSEWGGKTRAGKNS